MRWCIETLNDASDSSSTNWAYQLSHHCLSSGAPRAPTSEDMVLMELYVDAESLSLGAADFFSALPAKDALQSHHSLDVAAKVLEASILAEQGAVE